VSIYPGLRRICIATVAVALAATTLAGCAQPTSVVVVGGPVPARPTRKLVRLAFAGPLTGPNAVYGQGMLRATRLAVAQANRIPNVAFAGYRFELVAYDDRSDPAKAVNVAEQIVDKPDIAGVVGHFDSGCSIPASAVYHKAGMMMVSVSSDPKLTEQGFDNVFRMVPRDTVQGAFAADLVSGTLGKHRVAVVSDTTSYGRNLAAEFAKELGRNGGGVVLREQVSPTQTDFATLVSRIGATGPQAVYYAGAYKAGAGLSRRLKSSGINEPFVGGDTLYSQAYLDAAGGTDADGDIATALGLPLEQQPGYTTFARLYKAAYPDAKPGQYDPYAFDSAWIVMDSLVGAGVNASRSARIAYTHAHPFDNVTGQAVFDANGDTSNETVSSYRVQKGAWVLMR
jgi:branched-chain amino acid transport system substrate-binding protein